MDSHTPMSDGFEKRMNDYAYTDNPTFDQTAVIALDIAAAIKQGRYEDGYVSKWRYYETEIEIPLLLIQRMVVT